MAIKKSGKSAVVVPTERITQAILLIRGQKVLLDSHLAELYEVDIKVLNQAVKRNIGRCPADYMFQLTIEEADSLREALINSKM
jgi:hypothetical protein